MSWSDVIIGSGNKGNSATVISGETGGISISHNLVSYWVSNVYLEMGMTIFKDTEEGQELAYMIQANKPIDSIKDYLRRLLLLLHVDQQRLTNAVSFEIEQAFERGRAHNAAEIRNVLGVQ